MNNLTLVLATALVGRLATIEWHFAFAVYLLPAVTLLLVPALSHTHPEPEPSDGAQHRQKSLNRGVITGLMLFYFAITYLSLVVTFNTSYVASSASISTSEAGVIISLFFLAIMAPGFVLNTIVTIFGRWVNVASLVVMGIGLVVMSWHEPTALTLIVGAVLTGLGYGVMQPIIYDKAATNAPPHLATWALAIVMAVNYFAILVAPFIIDAIDTLLHASTYRFAFLFNGLCTLLLALLAALLCRNNRVLGSDD